MTRISFFKRPSILRLSLSLHYQQLQPQNNRTQVCLHLRPKGAETSSGGIVPGEIGASFFTKDRQARDLLRVAIPPVLHEEEEVALSEAVKELREMFVRISGRVAVAAAGLNVLSNTPRTLKMSNKQHPTHPIQQKKNRHFTLYNNSLLQVRDLPHDIRR